MNVEGADVEAGAQRLCTAASLGTVIARHRQRRGLPGDASSGGDRRGRAGLPPLLRDPRRDREEVAADERAPRGGDAASGRAGWCFGGVVLAIWRSPGTAND